MKPTLYLIRGLPDSGKSTFAQEFNAIHIEADLPISHRYALSVHPEVQL